MDTSKIIKIIADVIIYATILIAWRFVDSSVPKINRGFFCGDPALSLPYRKSTIRGMWLHVNFYGVPVIIALIEVFLQGNVKQRLLKTVMRSLTWFKFYFFTFISLIILMATVKNLSGVHRPFFFDICKPNLAINCTQGSYVSSEFNCTNESVNDYLLSESTRSFPSGHVVSVVYSCGVLMWYLQVRIKKLPIVVTFLHLICLLWMAVCSVTRVTDNWHHVSDVLGGLIMTLPFIFYNCFHLCKNFTMKQKGESDKE